MDSITHLALGACMGEAFAGKTLGKKAMLWGALAQSIPDIDFLASFWMNTTSNLLAHRGFTHSLLFCALIMVWGGLNLSATGEFHLMLFMWPIHFFPFGPALPALHLFI